MEFLQKKLSSDVLFRILFQMIFWFFWLALPILNASFDGDTERMENLIKILPYGFFCIPFFYLNSEYLVLKFIHKGLITSYILWLFVTFLVFLTLSYFYKDYLIDKYPIRIYDSRTLFPVLFILSMSTLYGVIIYLVKQARISQEEQAERLKSELSFLRSQISPHFIFNVLNSIVYLIQSKSVNAEKVTLELSELIRYMLYDSENKQVILKQEIEYLKNYIELQKIRFGDDVEIVLNLNGDFSSKMIEPMLLIPFVENAFKHGVGSIKKPKIEINVNSTEKDFVFNVKNFVSNETSEQKDLSSGIGLKNVKRRVDLLYPDENNLSIIQNDGVFEINLYLKLKEIN